MTEPLLRVQDLVKYFSVRGGLLSREVDRVHHRGIAPEQAAANLEVLGQILDAQERLNRITHRPAISSAGSTSTQATLWPPPTSRSGGTASRHFAMA